MNDMPAPAEYNSRLDRPKLPPFSVDDSSAFIAVAHRSPLASPPPSSIRLPPPPRLPWLDTLAAVVAAAAAAAEGRGSCSDAA